MIFENIVNKIGFDQFVVLILIVLSFILIGIVNFFIIRRNIKKYKHLKDFIKANWLFTLVLFLITMILWLGISFLTYNSLTPTIISSKPINAANWINYNEPIEVEFNVPVDVGSIDPRLNPKFEGKWVWESFFGIKTLTMKGRFYPIETVVPNQRIVIYLVGIKRLGFEENHELTLNFFAPKAPEIAEIVPNNGSEDFRRDQEITIKLDKKNFYLSNWEFKIVPEVKLEPIDIYTDVIKIKATEGFSSNVLYKLTIIRKPVRYNLEQKTLIQEGERDLLFESTFRTAKEPLIETFAPQGIGARPDIPLTVKFSLPMVRSSVEKNFQIEPTISGKFNWVDDSNMTFTPSQPFTKGTVYKVKFAKGMESLGQDSSSRDVDYQFETVGITKVISFDPIDGNMAAMETSSIYMAFNQEVNKEQAQLKFQIEPNISGKFSWNGNVMMFQPDLLLAYGQTYVIRVYRGVESLYGDNSIEDFVATFRIRPSEIIIGGVPQLYQPNGSFSCNIYAAIMLLSWKGKPVYASDLIAEMGYNPTQYGNGQWAGNPYREYVGNADGSYGYGVYWPPIQNAFSRRGINTEVKEGWNLNGIAQSLVAGHPVIIWRYNGESSNYDRNWVAADGAYVTGINGQHGSAIIGFRGPITNPTEFLLNDPWYGQWWYDSGFLDYSWSRMNRTALIIY